MAAREFLNKVVRPNIKDYQANCADIRLAYNAITSLDHLIAHLYHEIKLILPKELKDDTAYRESLAKISPDVAILRDIAKALKHVELDRGKDNKVDRANQVNTRIFNYGHAPYGAGRYGAPNQIWVETNDGRLKSIETLITKVLLFLEKEMEDRKI